MSQLAHQQPMRSVPTPEEREHGPSDSVIWAWFWFTFLAFWPRLFIIGFWIFGSQLGRAYDSWVIPAIGFLVAPSTTLAYALMWVTGRHGVHDAEWLVVAAAVLLDVITWSLVRRLSD